MSIETENLNLFKYDPVEDQNSTFNITNALNNNWNIIDSAIGSLQNLTTSSRGSLVSAINEINSNYGSWTVSVKALESNIAASGTVTTYDLVQLGVIPDQNNTYELLYTATAITNATAAAGCDLILSDNGIMSDGAQIVLIRAQTSADVAVANYISSIFPVRGGIIKVKSNVTSGKRGLTIHAYRKVQ